MHTPVAIVGGGPCGLTLALQLAQRNIACLVFEKKPGLSTHPKSVCIRVHPWLNSLQHLSAHENENPNHDIL
jgi:2-polyprenyl-6-methoxyphenol hydroxylase-like FAD-dependent oxidoreductase